jgi:hypothetical protein
MLVDRGGCLWVFEFVMWVFVDVRVCDSNGFQCSENTPR